MHDIDDIVEKFEGTREESAMGDKVHVALVGIHLCNLLSPSCIGIANSLGPEKFPFICMAPCCLPRVVRDLCKSDNVAIITQRSMGKYVAKESVLPIRINESADERRLRKVANYLCSEMRPIHNCDLLPPDANERLEIFQ